jgi:phospholipid/cholesterol/gamma-HCH transport system ATP-binding protein
VTDRASNIAIRLESLHYRVQGRDILRGVDLEIHQGEILAIMGRSGSGKTTLLRLMMGLIHPQSGAIWVDGTEISQLPEQDLLHMRLQMGFVFQNAALFDSLTVGENVAFGPIENHTMKPEEIADQVATNLAHVGMEGTQHLLPAELSGGMRKRVGVARALIMQPSVMFYDEPTAGLDPPTAASLNELIVDLRNRFRVTTVIVSHDVPALAQVVDRAAILENGRIMATDSLQELAQSQQSEIKSFFLFWQGKN